MSGLKIFRFVVPDMHRDDIVAFGKTKAEAEKLAEKLWVILNKPLLEAGWGQETWEEAKEWYGAYSDAVSVPSVWHRDEVPLSELRDPRDPKGTNRKGKET